MGWTSYNAKNYDRKGRVDRVAEVKELLTENGKNGIWNPLKVSAVGSTVYAAVERIKPDGERYVFAAVFLTHVNNKDYFNFSYKDMDESCFPREVDCPVSILNLLTPTDHKYAVEWRAACRENAAKKNEKRKDPDALSNLPFGSIIEMPYWKGGTKLLEKQHGYSPKVIWTDGQYRYTPKTIEKQGYTVISRN